MLKGGGGGGEKGRKKERKKEKISRRPRLVYSGNLTDILFWSSFFYLFVITWNLVINVRKREWSEIILSWCAPLDIAIMFLPTNRICLGKVLQGLFQDPYFLPSSGH